MHKHSLDLELFLDDVQDRLVCTDGTSVPVDFSFINPMIQAGVLTKHVTEFGERVLSVNPEVFFNTSVVAC